MTGEEIGLAGIALTAVGGVVAVVALRRDRLAREATRPRARVTIRAATPLYKGYDPLQAAQLHLVADFRAINELVIVETWLVAGDPRGSDSTRQKGRTPEGHSGRAVVKAGLTVTRRWPHAYTQSMPEDLPWWVCWEDTEGALRDCVRVPDDTRAQLARPFVNLNT